MPDKASKISQIEQAAENSLWKAIQLAIRHFSWVHLTLALLGNFAFLVGSVLFLWEPSKIYGVWLFILGAAGMFLGSVGNLIVWLEKDDRNET